MTRRQFGRGVTATAVLLGTAGMTGLGLALTGGGIHGFGVEHDDSVMVWVGGGELFSVEVIERSTGAVLQRETDLDLDRVLEIESPYVRFYRVTPPGL